MTFSQNNKSIRPEDSNAKKRRQPAKTKKPDRFAPAGLFACHQLTVNCPSQQLTVFVT